MRKPTRKELQEAMIDMLAVAAVARRRGGFTDAECEALKPEIAKRANEIFAFHAALENGGEFPSTQN